MAYRINNKFVSKVEYEAYQQKEAIEAFGEEAPVSENVTVDRKPRTTDPVTAATIRVRKAKKELERVRKLHAKQTELPLLEAVEAEYDDARDELARVLDV